MGVLLLRVLTVDAQERPAATVGSKHGEHGPTNDSARLAADISLMPRLEPETVVQASCGYSVNPLRA